MDSSATKEAGVTPGKSYLPFRLFCAIPVHNLSSNTFELTQLTTTLPYVGSTAPFTADTNHGLDYRSGMIQTWNKFCFTTGYIEVAVTFPGPNENTRGYVSLLSSWVRKRERIWSCESCRWSCSWRISAGKVSVLFVGVATLHNASFISLSFSFSVILPMTRF